MRRRPWNVFAGVHLNVGRDGEPSVQLNVSAAAMDEPERHCAVAFTACCFRGRAMTGDRIEGEDPELFERSLAHAAGSATGPELDAALDDLGWLDAPSALDPRPPSPPSSPSRAPPTRRRRPSTPSWRRILSHE